jgi:hypothetical protein
MATSRGIQLAEEIRRREFGGHNTDFFIRMGLMPYFFLATLLQENLFVAGFFIHYNFAPI